MATSRGNKRRSETADAAETRVRTVVAPTGFERLWTLSFRGLLP
jgi:hypothetical protein